MSVDPFPPDEDDAAEKKPALYWVGLYLVNRTYGGPEEGGWWYDSGELVTDPAFYAVVGEPPSCHMAEARAIEVASRMNGLVHKLNLGRRPISSVLSDGVYGAMIHEGTLPLHFPIVRPHYE